METKENFFFNESAGGYIKYEIPNSLTTITKGIYRVSVIETPFGQPYVSLVPTKIISDKLIELNSKAYKKMGLEVEKILNPDTRKKFKERGLVVKRNFILEGPYGTGKSMLLYRMADLIVEHGGLVLVIPPDYDARVVKFVFEQLASTPLKDTLTMVLIDEADKFFETQIETALQLLDGVFQKENIMFAMATNFIETIDPRVLRPGRVPSIIHVGALSASDRREYLLGVKLSPELVDLAVENTSGFTIDELRELMVSVECLDIPIAQVIKRIKQTKNILTPDQINSDRRKKGAREMTKHQTGNSIERAARAITWKKADVDEHEF